MHFARAPARCHPVPRHAVRTPAPLSSTQAAPSGGTTRPRWLSCGTVPPLYFPCVMVVTVAVPYRLPTRRITSLRGTARPSAAPAIVLLYSRATPALPAEVTGCGPCTQQLAAGDSVPPSQDSVAVHQSPLVVAPLLLLACCCCLLVVVAAAAACCRLPSCGSTACVASVVTGWPLDAAAGKVKQLRRQWRKIRPASACPRPASTATRQTWRQGPACLR